MQLIGRQLHDGILISDAGKTKVDRLISLIKRKFVIAFGIAAGAVLRVEYADVHVFHAEVAIDYGGLGINAFKKAKQNNNG